MTNWWARNEIKMNTKLLTTKLASVFQGRVQSHAHRRPLREKISSRLKFQHLIPSICPHPRLLGYQMSAELLANAARRPDFIDFPLLKARIKQIFMLDRYLKPKTMLADRLYSRLNPGRLFLFLPSVNAATQGCMQGCMRPSLRIAVVRRGAKMLSKEICVKCIAQGSCLPASPTRPTNPDQFLRIRRSTRFPARSSIQRAWLSDKCFSRALRSGAIRTTNLTTTETRWTDPTSLKLSPEVSGYEGCSEGSRSLVVFLSFRAVRSGLCVCACECVCECV